MLTTTSSVGPWALRTADTIGLFEVDEDDLFLDVLVSCDAVYNPNQLNIHLASPLSERCRCTVFPVSFNAVAPGIRAAVSRRRLGLEQPAGPHRGLDKQKSGTLAWTHFLSRQPVTAGWQADAKV